MVRSWLVGWLVGWLMIPDQDQAMYGVSRGGGWARGHVGDWLVSWWVGGACMHAWGAGWCPGGWGGACMRAWVGGLAAVGTYLGCLLSG